MGVGVGHPLGPDVRISGVQERGSDWFDGVVLNDLRRAHRGDQQWIERVVECWGARYEQRVPGAALQVVAQHDATFLLDVDLEHGWSRTVVAVARLHAPGRARDRAYQAGFPLSPPADRQRDRGHLIPNAGAGEYGPNLFAQDTWLNRGWSFDGRRFRAAERRAIQLGALYFCGLDYCDDSEIPAVVTSGWLDGPAGWAVDVYRNRFDAAARDAFPDATRPTDLDAVLRSASSAVLGDLGEETARAYLENERGELIVDLDDSRAPRRKLRPGVDIVAVDGTELVAYEVKTRLHTQRRRTRAGGLVRPRLARAGSDRQASQQYVLQRLTDIIDVGPDSAVTVRVIVVDLSDMLLQQFDVNDSGRPARPNTKPTGVREHAEAALGVLLERTDP